MRYDSIWETLKQTGRAEVVVSKEAVNLVVTGVRDAKYRESYARKKAGLIAWSRMVVQRDTLSATRVKLTFTFAYSTKL